jgi:hypothetical protein
MPVASPSDGTLRRTAFLLHVELPLAFACPDVYVAIFAEPIHQTLAGSDRYLHYLYVIGFHTRIIIQENEFVFAHFILTRFAQA